MQTGKNGVKEQERKFKSHSARNSILLANASPLLVFPRLGDG